MLNNVSIALERQNLQNESLSDLYTDDNKSKYSSNLRRFYEFWKIFMKNFTARRQLPKLLLMVFLAKFLTERKYLMNSLTFVRQKSLQMRSYNLQFLK